MLQAKAIHGESALSSFFSLVIITLMSNSGFAQQPLGLLHISQSSGRVLTTLRVAGSDPVPVVFDTGTSGNIIDRKLAAKLGLPNLGPSTAIDGSLGKPVAGFLTEVKGASLGGLSIDAGQANAIDYDLPNEKGIFGPNSFPEKLIQMEPLQGICFGGAQNGGYASPRSGYPLYWQRGRRFTLGHR